MTLGAKLISELAHRRQLGMYFNYAGYRAIKRIDTVTELAEFLKHHGFANVPVSDDVMQIADGLCDSCESNSSQSLLTWIVLDPFGGIVGMPLWLLWCLGRHRS
jgi:hypothetical protein